MMEKMRVVLKPINAQFLADSRAILDATRQEAWDGCAVGLDLMPQRGRGGRGGLDAAKGPNVGDEAPDFELTDLDENTLSLSSLRGKPVVIEFGSYTCPVFRRKVTALADLRSEYGDDVQWIMIYTLEAHPTDGRVAPVNTRAGIEIPQHTSFEKRLECAKLCAEKLDLKLHVLVDGYQNKVTDAYSGRPNRGYVLDAEGKVVSKQVWIEVEATRKALDAILQRNASDKPTRTTKPS
ncbi:MAG: redoxin domain-containing protein [Planctomycetes bacterium]|nr:redoxin domain-containing protein [Planctomycetota bacterium]